MTQKLSEKAYQNKKNYNKEYNSKKIECVCGSVIRYDKKYIHVKSFKHINFLNQASLKTCGANPEICGNSEEFLSEEFLSLEFR